MTVVYPYNILRRLHTETFLAERGLMDRGSGKDISDGMSLRLGRTPRGGWEPA